MISFSQIFKKIVNFVRSLQGSPTPPPIKPSVQSSGYIRPGKVFIHSYADVEHDRIPRLVLIVSFKRGPTGMFVSSRNNLLVCCFKLTDNVKLMRVVLKHLYQNAALSSYKHIRTVLIKLFGKKNCRTYMLHKMRNLHEVKFSPVNFPSDEPDPYSE